MRIGVLSFQEKAGRDRPTQHVSKSTAIKWLTLGTHRPVDKRTIQQLDPATVGKRPCDPPSPETTYIPDRLPRAELSHLRADGIKRLEFYPRILTLTVQKKVLWQKAVPLKWNRQYA